MRELVIGNGFIGQAYAQFSEQQGHEVHVASRHPADGPRRYGIDLTDPASIEQVLRQVQPEVIVNCAASLGRKPGDDVERNPVMTRNLLEAVRDVRLQLARIVILGSASEYGPVTEDLLPMRENAPLNADDPYGKSKRAETAVALELAEKYDLPVVVARIFNPIGPSQPTDFLIPRLVEQIKKQRDSEIPEISVWDLQASRDFFHIKDCVRAMTLLAHARKLSHSVYNIGSGIRTTNGEVIQTLLRYSGITNARVTATSAEPTPLLGSAQADITRLQELGYQPAYSLDSTLAEIAGAAGLVSTTADDN